MAMSPTVTGIICRRDDAITISTRLHSADPLVLGNEPSRRLPLNLGLRALPGTNERVINAHQSRSRCATHSACFRHRIYRQLWSKKSNKSHPNPEPTRRRMQSLDLFLTFR